MVEYTHNPGSGMVEEAEFIPSPNFDARPDATPIDVIVIHAICLPPRTYGNRYVEDFFTNCLDPCIHPYFETIAERRVSAHFYIRRPGNLIQFVPTLERAWHAGESSFHGRVRVNDFSIGIELEGCDDHVYEDAQYLALTSLVDCLRRDYPMITLDNITGHADISPGRKTDPGPNFDWQRFLKALKA